MKKVQFKVQDDFGYTVVGICCQLKDYRFSWYLNNKMGIMLEKTDDMPYALSKNEEVSNFGLYQYQNEKESLSFYLINNHAAGRKIMVPEQKTLQYFLIIEGSFHQPFLDDCLQKIRQIPHVLTAIWIGGEQLKKFENVFYYFEMHIINWQKKQKELLKKKQLYGKSNNRTENS